MNCESLTLQATRDFKAGTGSPSLIRDGAATRVRLVSKLIRQGLRLTRRCGRWRLPVCGPPTFLFTTQLEAVDSPKHCPTLFASNFLSVNRERFLSLHSIRLEAWLRVASLEQRT